MTYIQPTQFIRNGLFATKFATIINFDDCKTFATFQATFYTDDDEFVHQQTVALNGEDYKNWDGNNSFPAEWVTICLNLNIVQNEP